MDGTANGLHCRWITTPSTLSQRVSMQKPNTLASPDSFGSRILGMEALLASFLHGSVSRIITIGFGILFDLVHDIYG
jgi:hypothetical protein